MKETIKEQELETVFEKGIRLEKEFADYMNSHLGWKHFKIRKQMSSKSNMSGTNVDVIAERLNPSESDKFNLIALFYGLVCICTFIYGFTITETNFGISLFILLFSAVFAVFGFLFRQTAMERMKEHAWVECKNLKDKVSIKLIQIMIAERNAYNESKEKEYRIVETYFVSANGFVETALKYALDNKVRCFVKSDNSFKEKKYWDNE